MKPLTASSEVYLHKQIMSCRSEGKQLSKCDEEQDHEKRRDIWLDFGEKLLLKMSLSILFTLTFQNNVSCSVS